MGTVSLSLLFCCFLKQGLLRSYCQPSEHCIYRCVLLHQPAFIIDGPYDYREDKCASVKLKS